MVVSLLNALPVVAFTLFSGVLINMISTDVEKRSYGWAVQLLRYAVTKLPATLCERYEEEWLADLNDQPSGLSQLLFTTGLIVAAHKINLTERRRLTQSPLRTFDRVKKRMLDVAVTFSAIIFLAPLLILVAIAIKLETRGPVFTRQIWMGRGKILFTIYLFRSAVAANGSKVDETQCVTRVGRIIRATDIDTLPLLFNVLRGEMSLVGPPLSGFRLNSNEQKLLKPGLTGPSQIREYPNYTLNNQVIAKRKDDELNYIRGWGLWRDIKLMLKTVIAVIKK